MRKILIIEDDDDINQMLADTLAIEGFDCTSAYSGTEGLMRAEQGGFDLILLDLMLPGKCGEQVLEDLRSFTRTPVIVISAKDELDNKVDLLLNGADDYITKPFQIKELVARIYVQLRKQPTDSDESKIRYKDMTLDLQSRTAELLGHELALTNHEFNILALLFGNKNKVFSKQEIFDCAWEDYYEGEDKTINVHISNIRIKIRKITDEPYVETVWGIGFKAAD